MKKMVMLLLAIILFACGKDDPKPPKAAKLLFPLENSECTEGRVLSDLTSEVEFRWAAGANTKDYELRVVNLLTNVGQSLRTEQLSAKLPILKGTPYSWVIISRNTQTDESATSATWKFYNAGSQTNYAPFPAAVISPKSGASVVRDINNEVTLQWDGADVDNDIALYEIYFSETDPPETLEASLGPSTSSYKVSVAADTVYYWKVVTIDRQGNRSESGVFGFKSL
ncbi:MAG: hypothetical protein HKN61_09175 [Flavobacteriaceae bacterium]|nr:hypothetical protein [Flavobacteriaceae bacterium]